MYNDALCSVVELYCDGACLGNPGPGGWAYLVRSRIDNGFGEKENFGYEISTTNNRMELAAVINGLLSIPKINNVLVYSDSQYVVKGIKGWLKTWKSNNWCKADGSRVLNDDLWRLLDTQLSLHTIQINWVRGHSGHVENERVDCLAKQAAKIAFSKKVC